MIQLDGNYDEANRACRELALASGIEFANITLRPFYAEGAKTMAFEIVEQLDWVSPDHIVIPAAGGTLSSRVHKGLEELETVGLAETAATKISIAQADGCGPIATAILDGSGELKPQKPQTAAHSLAIGAPGDGPLVIDAVTSRGGSAATANDTEIFEAIDLLGATEGILTEPAGGTTIASTMKLAAQGILRARRDGRRGDQRQRLQDPRRAPREALALDGRLRGRGDGADPRRLPALGRRRSNRLRVGRALARTGVVVVLVGALLLGGCGGSGGSDTDRQQAEAKVESAVREAVSAYPGGSIGGPVGES